MWIVKLFYGSTKQFPGGSDILQKMGLMHFFTQRLFSFLCFWLQKEKFQAGIQSAFHTGWREWTPRQKMNILKLTQD